VRPAAGLVAALLATAAAAQGTVACPFIRPAGLAPSQVDAVVQGEFASQLRRPPEQVDRDKAIHRIEAGDDGRVAFEAGAASIGEELGFDAAAAFRAAAKARGSAPAEDTLTIAEMQEIARKAYAAGHDAPPPEAQAGVAFAVQGLAVRSPVPAQGWSLQRCTGEMVLFQRREPALPALSTAMVRLAGLPAFATPEAFEKQVREALETSLPEGLAVDTMTVKVVDGTRGPCANALVTGVVHDLPFGMLGRVCYLARDATLAWNTMFSRLGAGGFTRPSAIAEADAFVTGASPK